MACGALSRISRGSSPPLRRCQSTLTLLLEQSRAQMRAQKARTTRHKNSLFHPHTSRLLSRQDVFSELMLPRIFDRQNEERNCSLGAARNPGERMRGNPPYPQGGTLEILFHSHCSSLTR